MAGDSDDGRLATISASEAMRSRYPYMFTWPHARYAFYPGWMAVFVDLCAEVDRLLGPDKLGFRWRQVKEKLGSLRLYYGWAHTSESTLSSDDVAGYREPSEFERGIIEAVEHAIAQAEEKTKHLCMVCGAPAQLAAYGSTWATACEEHAPIDVERKEALRLAAVAGH